MEETGDEHDALEELVMDFSKFADMASQSGSEVPAFKVRIDDNGNSSFEGEKRSFSPLSQDIPKFKDIKTDWNDGKFVKADEQEYKKFITENDLNSSEGLSQTESEQTQQDIQGKDEGFSRQIPSKNGHWEGEPGNSKWCPDREHTPLKYNPENKTWGEILDEHGIDGIEFNEGEPDFSPVAEETVEIEDYSDDRDENYDAADETLADKWNAEAKDGKTDWTKEDIAQYRKDNELSWHECDDMKTMQLVPREIHLNVPHAGGISMAKNS